MLALVGGSGPDWETREVAVPTPGAGQVLVRVRAAGVNRADLGMLGGNYNPAGMVRGGEFTAGLELAGEVEGVGPGVDGVEAGDRVMAAALGSFGGPGFGDLLPATCVRGTIVNVGRLGGRRATVDLDQLAFRRLRVQGTTFSIRSAEERADVYAAVTHDALPTVADGRVRPVVDAVVPFAEAQRAADRMRSNEAVGKIVLEMLPR
jgi:NADPH:quinone reductase-like Zn-dependent oxidoreductase